MAGLPATGVMGCITFWPVNRPVVVKGLNYLSNCEQKEKIVVLCQNIEPTGITD